MDPIEEIICEAMCGTTSRDLAMCRVACNTVASSQMFCECGRVLDQRKVTVVTVKTPKRRVVQGFCPNCWGKKKRNIYDAADVTKTPCLVERWDGVEFSQGEVD